MARLMLLFDPGGDDASGNVDDGAGLYVFPYVDGPSGSPSASA